jgi:hypothetical protein
MRAVAPYAFATPLVDSRQLATDNMQMWMRAMNDFAGGEYRDFVPTCTAPGFALVGFTYRLTGGDCQVNIAYNFTGGSTAEVVMSLPVPAVNTFGPLTCYMNLVLQPVVTAVAVVLPDGNLHMALSGAPTFPAGTLYCQVAGRYRIA